jgi:pimeloyl-ACP methyl ester carboxylesterase
VKLPVNAYVQKEITVEGIRLHYLDLMPSEPSSKAPLLLLHQLLATAETFADLIRNLPKDRRIVALDMLSATPLSEEELTVNHETLATLIIHFAQSIELERPIVVGHSHGGALALRIAVTLREQVPGLVLMAPAHPFEGYRPHVVAFYLTRWGRFLALSIPIAPSWMILRAYNEASGPGNRVTMAQLKPYLRILRNRNTLRRVLDMLWHWEVDMAELRQLLLESPLKQSVLLIWGDHDVIVPIASAVGLQECLPHNDLIIVPGAGHLLAEEAPIECGRDITQWLVERHLP